MGILHNAKRIKKKRQYLRNNQTEAEKILWEQLKKKKLGFKFRRQHSINGYIVDFYCPKKHIAIEIDGKVHEYWKQAKLDKNKDSFLEEMNITVFRFTNIEVCEELNMVVSKIKVLLNKNYSK